MRLSRKAPYGTVCLPFPYGTRRGDHLAVIRSVIPVPVMEHGPDYDGPPREGDEAEQERISALDGEMRR
ncbi:hypothetical protein GCM10022398_19570 [Acetobacter lovaniensis]